MMDVRKYLASEIKRVVKMYAESACAQVRLQWTRYDVDGESKIGYSLEEAEADVTAAIVATGMKAWLLEYGKGSKMIMSEEDNPFLAEYFQDASFNAARLQKGMAVLGRPKGYYVDIDGKRHRSNGAREGWNLEELDVTRGGVLVNQPHLIVRKVLFGENNEGGIIAELNRVILDVCAETVEKILEQFPKEINLFKER